MSSAIPLLNIPGLKNPQGRIPTATRTGISEQPWMLPPDHPDILAMCEELKDMLRFWMDMGADGFRADMAGALVKNANITGNEQFFNARDNATKEFWQEIRSLLE